MKIMHTHTPKKYFICFDLVITFLNTIVIVSLPAYLALITKFDGEKNTLAFSQKYGFVVALAGYNCQLETGVFEE